MRRCFLFVCMVVATAFMTSSCIKDLIPSIFGPKENTEENEGEEENNGNEGKENKPASISLSMTELLLPVGGTEILSVKFTPDNVDNKTVTWVSSNSTVATVTDGIVVGVSSGTAEIIAKCGELTDRCKVAVYQPATSLTVPSDFNMNPLLYKGESVVLRVDLQPFAADEEIEWTTNDKSVVKIDQDTYNHRIYISSDNGSPVENNYCYILVNSVSYGTTTVTARAKTNNVSVSFPIEVGYAPTPEVVDLGLSVKWGKYNYSGTTIEDYGESYAWGDHVFNNGFAVIYTNASKYNEKDRLTQLEPKDDIIHILLGGKWRMPTRKEYEELINNCTWTHVITDSNDDFYTGTSNINGNTIQFFGGDVFWSSTLDPNDTSSAICFMVPNLYSDPRTSFHYIRPVYAD